MTEAATTGRGRTAQTKGVSMLPEELADVRTVEELTGLGFSEVYRRHFAPHMHAAAALLQQLREDGVEIDRRRLRDRWDVAITPDRLAEIYAAPSELTLGD